jgi:hypothetical protein
VDPLPDSLPSASGQEKRRLSFYNEVDRVEGRLFTMRLTFLRPYQEGSAVFIGFALGLLVALVLANVAFGLCLGVGSGAVVDGWMRVKAARKSLMAHRR